MRPMMNTILSILLCLGFAFASLAQETTSEIVGTVTTDQKPIGGATVTAS